MKICRGFVVGFLILLASNLSAATPVLTQHNNNLRTGANLQETTLTIATVNEDRFGLLFSRPVDDEIYTQPLYVPDVALPGGQRRSLVFVGTVNNTVYAFDAADPAAEAPIWRVNLGPAVPTSDLGTGGGSWCDTYHDFSHLVGITGTPVIDPVRQTLYVVAKTKEKGAFIQRLHALDVATGREREGSPVQIEAKVKGTGAGSDRGAVAFNPQTANQRPALLLLNGVVYLAFGAHCDAGPFHGWLLGYDTATLHPVSIFNTTPDGDAGGIWQSGQGPAADGDIFISTGNGPADPASHNYGMSVVRLRPQSDGTPHVVDWFTPYNWQKLNAIDRDLGSTGPLLLPGGGPVIACGKSGVLYLLDRNRLGHTETSGTDQAAAAEIQAVQSFPGAPNAHLKGSPIYWDAPSAGPTLYLWGQNDHLRAYRLQDGGIRMPAAGISAMAAPVGAPGAMLSLSANESRPGSGIVWASMPYNGDANQAVVPGVLRAFDASNVAHELWNSRQDPERDSFGEFAKFSYPTIADGKVFVATFSRQLCVYGLFPPRMPKPPAGLTAAAAENRVVLFWQRSMGASTYILKRSASPQGPFLPLNAGTRGLSYVDTGLPPGAYYYVVSAGNSYGQSDDSPSVTVTIAGVDSAVPAPPDGPPATGRQ